ncbi:hypothetical protein TanjilG_05981 [Lupinus angustifolius]|uniref:Beta-galactosidase n=1 Tax=Lupinus angustifolius TaxID=3871 RepID=A0A4P1RE23_LUPAN|nr:hypothetical protein TanjilG_05981 [Lupinus angustifolius]
MLNVKVVLLLLASSLIAFATASVSYDSKAITINGQRRILISGSIHYPRSTPEMWPDLVQKAKEGGLDVIQTYVFWNGHEPEPGKYYFEGNYDLVKFIKLVQQAGLYVNLRIGPYVCAEWNFGGFPVWLKYIPGISFRTDNGPFKFQMQKFTKKIVNMMKAERLYESQGGPIILSQIENEYGPMEYEIGAPGKSYTKWAADMALGLGTGVPWIMCKQDDAPDPIINTCNGFYCDYFTPNSAHKPKMWTEAWTGWFTEFGGPVPYRPAEDLAFSVARFIQKGGSFVNYYMYHGGTNFGRTAGGPFIATSYDYDAPLDEYGLLRQPKWGHLKDLHRAVKLCEPALVAADPTVTQIGDYQEIENEYGPMEYEIGAPGKSYTKWAADMALGLGTGVPWIMCKQDDAPDPIINTCNGFYCDYFTPNSAHKPKMWTEAWTGWFTEFGGPVPYRPAEDLAFSVARFIQKGGSFVNYYMYHGGTNFGRTAGGPFIATSYDYDAPLDEYGLLRQPKWGHLKDLHRAVKLCEPALVAADPTVTQIGDYQEAHVFKSKSGACAAFLANYNPKSYAKVAFGNMHYNLPPWSISILPDCNHTVYNTARIGSQSARMKMTRVPIHGGLSWQAFNEETASTDDSTFTMTGLLEQLNTTRDSSDYLWYSTDVVIDPKEGFLWKGKDPVLTVLSAGHALHVFVNGQLSGSIYGSLEFPKLTFSEGVNLRAGVNKISLLSVAVGLPNVGPHFETWNAGVLGPISLNGLDEGRRDLTWQKWSYKVGLKGETLSLHSLSGTSTVEWIQGSLISRKQPLTWYKTNFDAPAGDSPFALDMGSMGKGQVWLNGKSLGRYWPAYKASGTCDYCSYAGTYTETKCRSNCGEASQRWYHVPHSWLMPTGNLLVVFEELGGDPNGIFLVRRDIDSVCADIYEWQPNLRSYQMQVSGKVRKPVRPKAHLSCGPGQKISSIKFASFGTPLGSCGNFLQGGCHAHKSYDAFERNCIGQNWCTVTLSPENFGGDPCPNVMKKLAVLPSDSSKWVTLFDDPNSASSGSGENYSKKKRKKANKKKRMNLGSEERENSGLDYGFRFEPGCFYPFTSSSSAMQRRIKQQYDELVRCNESKKLTLPQVVEFANSLVGVRNELQHKAAVIQRRFVITKALLCKADRSTFDRLRQQIYKLELEQKRLEEDAFVYNSLQQQLKLSPAYQQMLEIGACMEKAKSCEPEEKLDDEFDDISFEELLAQEKKDSFWQKNGKSRICSR